MAIRSFIDELVLYVCLLASNLASRERQEACLSEKAGDLPLIVRDGIIGIDAL
jgi:hypothetical protein